MSRHIAIAIISITAVAVAGVACYRLMSGGLAHVELSAERYPVRGLDLSAHNGVPDFDSIAAAGYTFVYLKASEGVSHRDAAFMRNYLAARRAGLLVGAYHFFRFDSDGARQAANFLGAISSAELQLPWAIDIEEWGNPVETATAIVAERLATMIAMVAPRRGAGMIYTNKNGDARFVRGHYDDDDMIDLWICSFTDPPLTRRPWRIWQHSHSGHVPGVSGKVDLNVFNGDASTWHSWLESVSLQTERK